MKQIQTNQQMEYLQVMQGQPALDNDEMIQVQNILLNIQQQQKKLKNKSESSYHSISNQDLLDQNALLSQLVLQMAQKLLVQTAQPVQVVKPQPVPYHAAQSSPRS